MPGAMAYSAPEVLTGKYNEKIDIFSFGILLTQMSCSEYPRIERREEQLQVSISTYKPLKNILLSNYVYLYIIFLSEGYFKSCAFRETNSTKYQFFAVRETQCFVDQRAAESYQNQ